MSSYLFIILNIAPCCCLGWSVFSFANVQLPLEQANTTACQLFENTVVFTLTISQCPYIEVRQSPKYKVDKYKFKNMLGFALTIKSLKILSVYPWTPVSFLETQIQIQKRSAKGSFSIKIGAALPLLWKYSIHFAAAARLMVKQDQTYSHACSARFFPLVFCLRWNLLPAVARVAESVCWWLGPTSLERLSSSLCNQLTGTWTMGWNKEIGRLARADIFTLLIFLTHCSPSRR